MDALYNQLSQSTRDKIKKIYESKTDKDIDDLLRENKDVFVDWRYALEKEVNVCVSGLFSFAHSLDEYCKTIETNKH